MICSAIKRSGALSVPGIRRKSSDFNGVEVSAFPINPISWKSVTTSVIMPPQNGPGQAGTHEPTQHSRRPAPWPQAAASGRFNPLDRRLPATVHPARSPRPGRAFSGLLWRGKLCSAVFGGRQRCLQSPQFHRHRVTGLCLLRLKLYLSHFSFFSLLCKS